MDLSTSDTLELEDRCNVLLDRYAKLSFELVPKLEEHGRIRKELQIIVTELHKRGVQAKGTDETNKFVEDKLDAQKDNQ